MPPTVVVVPLLPRLMAVALVLPRPRVEAPLVSTDNVPDVLVIVPLEPLKVNAVGVKVLPEIVPPENVPPERVPADTEPPVREPPDMVAVLNVVLVIDAPFIVPALRLPLPSKEATGIELLLYG